jgi:hypothetical protein
MYLTTAVHFAVKKYGRKEGSNGTSVSLTDFLKRIKKGSGRYRKLLAESARGHNRVLIENLRVVTTFFELIGCEKPETFYIQCMHKLWTSQFLTNRIRMFCFQFFNNSLSVGARLAARYRDTGTYIDQRCSFCVISKNGVPHREDFKHIFIDCNALSVTLSGVWRTFFNKEYDRNEANHRLFMATGIDSECLGYDNFFNMLTVVLINFNIWNFKIRHSIPSVATMANEIDNLFSTIVTYPGIYSAALTHPSIVCRRWRSTGSRRG